MQDFQVIYNISQLKVHDNEYYGRPMRTSLLLQSNYLMPLTTSIRGIICEYTFSVEVDALSVPGKYSYIVRYIVCNK